jgi:hypothetical protein
VPSLQEADAKEEQKLAREREELALRYENEKRREAGLPPLPPPGAAVTAGVAATTATNAPNRPSRIASNDSNGAVTGPSEAEAAQNRARARSRLFGDDGDIARRSPVAQAGSPFNGPPGARSQDSDVHARREDLGRGRGAPQLPSPTAALLRERQLLEEADAAAEAQHLKLTTQAAVEKVCHVFLNSVKRAFCEWSRTDFRDTKRFFAAHDCAPQELQATREVMRLREELRQRERDVEFEHRLDRLADAPGPSAVPPLTLAGHFDDGGVEVCFIARAAPVLSAAGRR